MSEVTDFAAFEGDSSLPKMIAEDYHVNTFAEGAEKARAEGLRVVIATPYDIFLDLDTPEDVKAYEERLARIQRAASVWGITEQARWKSKSGVGTHVHLRGAWLEPQEQIAVQAILGSDPVREIIALLRMRQGVTNVSRFFKPIQKETF